jgi:hypothetical protein
MLLTPWPGSGMSGWLMVASFRRQSQAVAGLFQAGVLLGGEHGNQVAIFLIDFPDVQLGSQAVEVGFAGVIEADDNGLGGGLILGLSLGTQLAPGGRGGKRRGDGAAGQTEEHGGQDGKGEQAEQVFHGSLWLMIEQYGEVGGIPGYLSG